MALLVDEDDLGEYPFPYMFTYYRLTLNLIRNGIYAKGTLQLITLR